MGAGQSSGRAHRQQQSLQDKAQLRARCVWLLSYSWLGHDVQLPGPCLARIGAVPGPSIVLCARACRSRCPGLAMTATGVC